MRVQILGCAGGIGGRERLTTALLIDDDILLDAGTGLATLDLEQLVRIDHVFLTHAHLDHVAGLALLLDAVQGRREGPVTVHTTLPVINVLKTHLFNWALWPDFAAIPSPAHPTLRWQELQQGAGVTLKQRVFTGLPVNHADGSSAFLVRCGAKAFLFTGDMGSTPSLWSALKNEAGLEKIIVDCSFTDSDAEIAGKSRHFCPQSLLLETAIMPPVPELLIYHLKPGHETRIMQELHAGVVEQRFTALRCGDTFEV